MNHTQKLKSNIDKKAISIKLEKTQRRLTLIHKKIKREMELQQDQQNPDKINKLFKEHNNLNAKLREMAKTKSFAEQNNLTKVQERLFSFFSFSSQLSPEDALKKAMDVSANPHIKDPVLYCVVNNIGSNYRKVFYRLVGEGYTFSQAKKYVFSNSNSKIFDYQQHIDENRKADIERYLASFDELPSTLADDGSIRFVRVAVLAQEYPRILINDQQLNELENAIINEVGHCCDVNLQFGGIYLRQGMLLVDCANPETVHWLISVVPNLRNWNCSIQLMVCPEDEISMPHTLQFFLPNSSDKDFKTCMKQIFTQNDGLNIPLWRLQNYRKDTSAVAITVGVDEHSAETILKKNRIIKYFNRDIKVKFRS